MSDAHDTPTGLSRREIVAAMAAIAAGGMLRPTDAQAAQAMKVSKARTATGAYDPKVYTEHEWQTVRSLVDWLFPKDDRSGSATDAMVPEFMDTMLDLEPGMRTAHRGGLGWLDHECRERFGNAFIACTEAQQREMLDAIAWPAKASKDVAAGVQWFNSFRDLAATGFWTSEIGVTDIGYMGNTPQPHWTGCPQPNLTRLGF